MFNEANYNISDDLLQYWGNNVGKIALINGSVTLAQTGTQFAVFFLSPCQWGMFSLLRSQEIRWVLQTCTNSELCNALLFLLPFCLYAAYTWGRTQISPCILHSGHASYYGRSAFCLFVHTSSEYSCCHACPSFLLWYRWHTMNAGLIIPGRTVLNTF